MTSHMPCAWWEREACSAAIHEELFLVHYIAYATGNQAYGHAL